MADNVAVTAGSGTTIHADEYTHSTLGLGKTQLVKLVDGALDSSTAIQAGGGVEAGALRVTIASDSTGVLSVDDNGASLTVDNAALSVTGGGVEASAIRVTIASDSTGLVSVDDNGGSLTVDGTVAFSNSTIAVTNAGTFVVQENGAALTALQLIDDVVYTDDTSTHSTGASKGALFMAAATPTDASVNANDIGAVAMTTDRKLHVSVQDALPAGTNNIGDVDVLTLPALAAGTNNIGDVDILTIAAGDNNIGNVDIVTMPNVTIGTMANLTESLVDDAAFTPATSRVLPVGFTFDDTLPDSVNEGDIGAARMSANRNIYTTLRDAAGNERGVNVNASNQLSVSVDNTVTVGSHAVTNAGTFVVQENGAALTALQLIDDSIFADDAAFTLASSKTTVAGAVRDDSLSALTAIEGDVVPLRVSSTGALHVTGGGGGTEYTEDAAAAADPVGTSLILVRSDTPATITSADGDNVAQRGTNYGAAYVQLVTSSGSYIDSVGGGTEYTEDAAAAANPVGKALIYVRDDARAGGLTTADGDNVALRGNNAGEIYVKHTDTIAVTQSGTWDEVGINDSGNSITVDNAALSVTGGGVEASALRVTIANDSTGVLSVDDNGGSLTVDGTVAFSNTTIAVTNAGTFVVQENGSALTALQLIDDIVYTDDTSTHSTGSSKGALFMAAATPTDASVNANDIGAVAMTTDRKLHVSVQDALPAGTNNIGDVDVLTLPALAAGTNNIGDVDILTIAAGDNNIGNVDIVTMPNVTIGTMANLTESLVDDAAFTPATSRVLPVGFTFDDVAPDSVNEGDIGAARMSANRNVYMTIRDAAGNERGANVNASSQLSVSVDNTVTVGSHAVTNAGTFAVQVDGSALTALQLIDDPVIADDAAFTPATTKVMMAGFEADESSTDSVDEGDAGAARMTLDRKQIVTVQPHTTGGLSTMNATSSDGGTALTNTAQVIKASAGQVYGWYIYNPNSSAQFVQFYNTAAASVTVGTTNPLFMLTIPATAAANVNFVQGITFTNAGFSWAATSTAGGNGAPTTALDAVCFYA